jgi:hypothetical protein
MGSETLEGTGNPVLSGNVFSLIRAPRAALPDLPLQQIAAKSVSASR